MYKISLKLTYNVYNNLQHGGCYKKTLIHTIHFLTQWPHAKPYLQNTKQNSVVFVWAYEWIMVSRIVQYLLLLTFTLRSATSLLHLHESNSWTPVCVNFYPSHVAKLKAQEP